MANHFSVIDGHISLWIFSKSTEIHLCVLTMLILPFNYLQRCYSKEKSQKNFNFELRAKFKNIQWRLSAHFVTKLYFNLPFFRASIIFNRRITLMQSVNTPYSHYFHINENGYQHNFFLTIYHSMYIELIENYKFFF